jgi:hypothetical protein
LPVECAIAVETLVQIGTSSGIRKPHDESSTSKKWLEAQSRAKKPTDTVNKPAWAMNAPPQVDALSKVERKAG